MIKTISRRRRMKEPLSSHQSMAAMPHYLHLSLFRQRHHFSNSIIPILALFLCSAVISECASVVAPSNSHPSGGGAAINEKTKSSSNNSPDNNNDNPHLSSNYHFLDQHNEYDSSSSGVSILDDDTVRLSLAIDDDTQGLSVPSLHNIEPKVFLRVSGESGMLRPQFQDDSDNPEKKQNEVIGTTFGFNFHPVSTPPPVASNRKLGRADLHVESEEEETDQNDEVEVDDEDDDMSDNYHLHFPYIESFREKYTKLESHHFPVTTTPPPSSKDGLSKPRQVWSEIIAQVTTPSSFNEINSSASEHRLADYHIRANLPTYFYENSHKYPSYSEDDLENVADLDDEHSKYFVKTRPRSVSTAGSNIYNNFYYEPPSFSTKSVPIPVKTNKEKVIFASVKPTQDPQHLFEEEDYHDDILGRSDSHILHHHHHHDNHEEPDDNLEDAQQDAPIMTTNSPLIFPHQNIPQMTSPSNYDKEVLTDQLKSGHDKPASRIESQEKYKIEEITDSNNAGNKSSAETLDVSTSQSVLSKVTLNNLNQYATSNHHDNRQFVVIKADSSVSKTAVADTPQHSFIVSAVQIGTGEGITGPPSSDNFQTVNNDKHDAGSALNFPTPQVVTTPPTTELPSSTVASTVTESYIPTTTTDATGIPGVPGIDYPTLGEIPQTGFDCQKQRYKGFFADVDTKCQAWHYCDFTDSHSTFLCPNGTLFSQVLLTCDWWFNVDCNQARQLYVLNERLYRYIKPPKPSFPEDFIGEHVDKWLLQQFTDGYLPKVRKKSKAKFVPYPAPPPPSSEEPPTDKE